MFEISYLSARAEKNFLPKKKTLGGCRLLGRSPPNTDQRTDGSRAKLRSSHPGDNRGAAVVRAIVPATEEEAMTVEWRWWWPCLELVQPRRCLVDALCHLLGMLKQC